MNSRHFLPSIRIMAFMAATLLLTGTMFASGPQEKLLYSFQGPAAPNGQDGAVPNDLISDNAGNLYGVTVYGGICALPHHLSSQCGIVFELSPPASAGGTWTETVLYEFGTNIADGSNPVGNLVRDRLGNLYGVTFYSSSSAEGGTGCGDFYELSPPSQQGGAWTETILYTFQGYVYNDGCEPMGRLVADAKGNIYGPTALGGGLASSTTPKGFSTGGIFEMSPPTTAGGTWTESFTQNLGGGIYPEGGLTIDHKGILYGTAGSYGTTSPPTIFELIPPTTAGGTWTGTTIYTFQSSDGTPSGGLIQDAKGNIFGTTQNGGAAALGSAFELSPSQNGSSWTETILHSFQGGSDGQTPTARMTLDKLGNLYGTTIGGGSSSIYCSYWQGCGTVFKLTHGANSWREQVIYHFQGGPTDGFYPSAALLLSGETIYGTTTEGGTVSQYVYGTVFEIN